MAGFIETTGPFPTKSRGGVAGDDPFATSREQLGGMTRRQFERYEGVFAPREEELISELGDARVQRDVSRAGEMADIASGAAAGSVGRNLTRYGVSTTPGVQEYAGRKLDLAKALSRAGAEAGARKAGKQMQLEGKEKLLDLGQAVRRGAIAKAGAATDLEAARKDAYEAAKQRHEAAGASTLASGIGLLMAIA